MFWFDIRCYIHILLYYILLYIYYYYTYYILYHTLPSSSVLSSVLPFPIIPSSSSNIPLPPLPFLPSHLSSSLPTLLSLPSFSFLSPLLFYPPLPLPHPHSKYTCRHLDILIYIPAVSGWVLGSGFWFEFWFRCDVLRILVFC